MQKGDTWLFFIKAALISSQPGDVELPLSNIARSTSSKVIGSFKSLTSMVALSGVTVLYTREICLAFLIYI